jgi:hypothetical protein
MWHENKFFLLVAGCCEYSDEPVGSGDVELVSYYFRTKINAIILSNCNKYLKASILYHYNKGIFPVAM